MTCWHNNLVKQTLSKSIGNHHFEYEIDVCRDCGAALWSQTHELKFQEWLNDLYTNKKDAFTIQGIKIPYPVMDMLKEFISRYPGVDISDAIRAITLVFIRVVLPNDALSEGVEKAFRGQGFQALLSEKSEKRNVIFKPSSYVDIAGWAGLLEMSMPEFVSNAVLRFFGCYQNHQLEANAHRFVNEVVMVMEAA